MALIIYKNGAWVEPAALKRYTNGAWVECEFARRYVNGAWVDIWNNADRIEYGWIYTTGDVTPTYEYTVTSDYSANIKITHQSTTSSRSELILRYPYVAAMGEKIPVVLSMSNGYSTVLSTYCTLCLSISNNNTVLTKEYIDFKAFSGSAEYIRSYEITNDLEGQKEIVLVLQVYGTKGDYSSLTFNYVSINGEKIKFK